MSDSHPDFSMGYLVEKVRNHEELRYTSKSVFGQLLSQIFENAITSKMVFISFLIFSIYFFHCV